MVTSSGAAQLTKAFEHNRDRVERDLTYKHSDEKTAINAAILLRSADLRYLIGKKTLLTHCISKIIIIWLRGQDLFKTLQFIERFARSINREKGLTFRIRI